jgi:hypothetical protein
MARLRRLRRLKMVDVVVGGGHDGPGADRWLNGDGKPSTRFRFGKVVGWDNGAIHMLDERRLSDRTTELTLIHDDAVRATMSIGVASPSVRVATFRSRNAVIDLSESASRSQLRVPDTPQMSALLYDGVVEYVVQGLGAT